MFMVRWLIGVLLFLVFALFAFVVWLALNEDIANEGGEPPLIKAEGLPFKEEPSERGGIAVMNEGSSLVQALDRGPDEAVIERILPAPETPPRSAAEVLPEQPATTASNASELPQTPGVTASVEAPEAPEPIEPAVVEALESSEPAFEVTPIEPIIAELTLPDAESTERPEQPTAATSEPQPPRVADAPAVVPNIIEPTSDDQSTQPVPVITEPVVPKPVEEIAVTPAATVEQSSPAIDAFRVQLSALREEAQATSAWRQYQNQFPEILGDRQVFVERSETDRGIFYRVQAGLYGSREDASAACEAIKAGGGDCFVVRGVR